MLLLLFHGAMETVEEKNNEKRVSTDKLVFSEISYYIDLFS